VRRFAFVAVLAATIAAAHANAGSAPPLRGHIVYSTRYFAPNAGDSWEIFVVGPYGDRRRNVSNSPGCDDGDPAISRDGRLIAEVCGSLYKPHPFALLVLNVDGSGGRTLLTTRNSSDLLGGPSWSPDGRLVAVTYEGFISTIDVATGRVRRLVRGGGGTTWSPDGRWIAFGRNHGGISVVGADGRRLRSLTRSEGLSPQWSPDGRTIMFSTDTTTVLVRPDGGGRSEIDAGEGAAWSPDSRRIVFYEVRGIWIEDRNGTHQRKIADEWDNAGVAWGP
jgi:Tol biopolymer transport system component